MKFNCQTGNKDSFLLHTQNEFIAKQNYIDIRRSFLNPLICVKNIPFKTTAWIFILIHTNPKMQIYFWFRKYSYNPIECFDSLSIHCKTMHGSDQRNPTSFLQFASLNLEQMKKKWCRVILVSFAKGPSVSANTKRIFLLNVVTFIFLRHSKTILFILHQMKSLNFNEITYKNA